MFFKKKFKIGNSYVGNKDKVFVIAEIGVNHNGNILLAKRLVDEAAKAGADCVKFQTFTADSLVNRSTPKTPYQIKNTNFHIRIRRILPSKKSLFFSNFVFRYVRITFFHFFTPKKICCKQNKKY